MFVDYRRLNTLTVKNKFPLTVIDEIFDKLSGAQWFISLDMTASYQQILMAEGDQYKTAFQTHHGTMNTVSCPMVSLVAQLLFHKP